MSLETKEPCCLGSSCKNPTVLNTNDNLGQCHYCERTLHLPSLVSSSNDGPCSMEADSDGENIMCLNTDAEQLALCRRRSGNRRAGPKTTGEDDSSSSSSGKQTKKKGKTLTTKKKQTAKKKVTTACYSLDESSQILTASRSSNGETSRKLFDQLNDFRLKDDRPTISKSTFNRVISSCKKKRGNVAWTNGSSSTACWLKKSSKRMTS
jgi:hypothetical protein